MTNSDRRQIESHQDRYGLRIAARLSLGTDSLPHDITERLKAARMQALGQRKVAQRVPARAAQVMGALAVLGGGDEPVGWWRRVGAVLPLVVLVVGLLTIHTLQNDQVADELAALDAALLTDDLPPSAYSDPGFARFVAQRREPSQ